MTASSSPQKYRSYSKKEIRQMLHISESTLRKWMNEMYYDQLVKLGYNKRQKLLTPSVVEFLTGKLDL